MKKTALLLLLVVFATMLQAGCSYDKKCLNKQLRLLKFEAGLIETKFNIEKRKLDSDAIGFTVKDMFADNNQFSRYLHDRWAIRAMMYCNAQKISVRAVYGGILKKPTNAEGNKAVAACLKGYVRNNAPKDTAGVPIITVEEEEEYIKTAIEQKPYNPVLRFLYDNDGGPAEIADKLFELYLVNLGMELKNKGNYVDAIDAFSRARILVAKQAGGEASELSLLKKTHREALKTVYECAKTSTFGELVKNTRAKAYTAGIPCVDAKQGQNRITTYQKLGIGMRSPELKYLLATSRTADEVRSKLSKKYMGIIKKIEEAESGYISVSANTYEQLTTSIQKLVYLRTKTEIAAHANNEKPLNTLSQWITPTGKGATMCGIGIAKSFVTWQSGALIVLGGALLVAGGPVSIGIVSFAFIGTGVATTALSTYTMEQEWDYLNKAEKVERVCDVAAQTAFIVIGARGVGFKERAKGMTVKELVGKLEEAKTKVKEALPKLKEAATKKGFKSGVKKMVETARERLRSAKTLSDFDLVGAYRNGKISGLLSELRKASKKYDPKNNPLNEKIFKQLGDFLSTVEEHYPGMTEKIIGYWEKHAAAEAPAYKAMTGTVEFGGYTTFHVIRTTVYAYQSAMKSGKIGGLTPTEVGINAALHDVGKLGADMRTLLSKERLTPAEQAEIAHHSAAGYDVLLQDGVPKKFAQGAKYHHGKGSEVGTHIAIADVLDAIESARPYKAGKSISEAVKVTMKSRGMSRAEINKFVQMLEDLELLDEAQAAELVGR